MSNEKYDQEFAHAMALKLRLNREKRSVASEESTPVREPSAPSGDFRQEMAQSIAMKRGVTVEKVMDYLEAFGF
jgi:hypothetical protein